MGHMYRDMYLAFLPKAHTWSDVVFADNSFSLVLMFTDDSQSYFILMFTYGGLQNPTFG